MTGLTLPRAALDELLGTWSGDGELLDAVAASDQGQSWSRSEIRRRSNRVLLGVVEPDLRTWPATAGEWADHLPPAVTSHRVVMRAPSGSVRWHETARRFGWPPTAYVGTHRSRAIDEVSVSTLAWLVNHLETAAADIKTSAPGIYGSVSAPLSAARTALAQLGSAQHPVPPDRTVLRSLAASGAPWRSVAAVGSVVQRSRTDLRFLAFELIEPDPAGRGALFHLCVFGEVVRSLRSLGFEIRWNTALGSKARVPQVTATDRDGMGWDVWYEAGAAHRYYGLKSQLFGRAVKHVPGAGGTVGADIGLIAADGRSLLLECKWSSEVTYVAREGYHQAASYALDMAHATDADTWSFVVGPEEVVPAASAAAAPSLDVVVGSVSIRDIQALVSAFLVNDPEIVAPSHQASAESEP